MAAAGLYKGYTYLVLETDEIDAIDAAAPTEVSYAISRFIDNALSVSLGELIDGSVDEDAIADDAVTTDKILNEAVTTAKIDDGAVNNAKIAADAAIALSKLATLTAADIIVADGDGIPTAVALSGDATISDAGALTIATNAVTTTKTAVDVLQKATLSITATQLRKLNATPLSVIAAPGANKAILIESCTAKMTFVANAYDSVGSGDDLVLRYTDGSGTILTQLETVGFLDQASSQVRISKPTTTAGTAGLVNLTPTANAAVVAHILTGEIAAADADINGDGTLLLTVYYRVLDV